MKKVLFIQPILTHYRKSVFLEIVSNTTCNFTVIGGEKYLTNKLAVTQHPSIINFDYRIINIWGQNFYWLKKCLSTVKKKSPDIVVMTGINPRMLHTLYLYVLYKFVYRKKIVWWSMGFDGYKNPVSVFWRMLLYKNSDGIICYSKIIMNEYQKLGVAPTKMVVANNSIADSDYGFNNYDILELRSKQKNSKFKILCTGKLIERKKIFLLCEAAKVLLEKGVIDFEINIVGDGVEYDKINNLIDNYDLKDHVFLKGALYGSETVSYFLEADLFCIPGTVGLAIVQCCSYGLPILSTDQEIHGPEIELLKKGYNGDTYSGLDPINLATKIVEWEKVLKTRKVEIASNCLESIKTSGYTPINMANNITNFLEQI